MNMKITFYFDFKIFSFFHKDKNVVFYEREREKRIYSTSKILSFQKKEIFKVKQIKF